MSHIADCLQLQLISYQNNICVHTHTHNHASISKRQTQCFSHNFFGETQKKSTNNKIEFPQLQKSDHFTRFTCVVSFAIKHTRAQSHSHIYSEWHGFVVTHLLTMKQRRNVFASWCEPIPIGWAHVCHGPAHIKCPPKNKMSICQQHLCLTCANQYFVFFLCQIMCTPLMWMGPIGIYLIALFMFMSGSGCNLTEKRAIIMQEGQFRKSSFRECDIFLKSFQF